MKMTDYQRGQAPDDASPGQGAQSVVRMLRSLFATLRILIVLVVIFAFFQGVFVVREQEQAMVFRFGRLIAKDGAEILESGRLYWAWPYPIDQVKRIPAERAVTLRTDHFWSSDQAAELRGEEQAAEMSQGLVPGEDGYLLTGDANIVHMTAQITYRIADAKKYYLDFFEGDSARVQKTGDEMVTSEAAEAIIRNCLENAMLKETAEWTVDDIIKRSRPAVVRRPDDQQEQKVAPQGDYLSNAIQKRVEKLVSRMDVGIEIDKVTLTNVRPPIATADAFQRVNDAIQERDTMLKEAQTYEDRVVNKAESELAKIMARARAYQKRVESSVRADLDYFRKVLDEYESNPETMLVALYTDTIRDVLKKAKEQYVIHARQDGDQEVRLLVGPEPEDQDETVPPRESE